MCKPWRVDRLADLPGRPCSAAAALDVVGDRWALLVVRELMFGNHRFTDLVRNTGAPRDRLAARLKDLVEAGVVEKRQYQQAPPRSEYHLTRAGRDLAPVLQALLAWGDRWAVDEPPMQLRHHDHELHMHQVCDVCGERVRRADVTREVRVEGWDEAGPVAAG
ncbi:helix-turn-helix domain-containing protein [Angustibacter peucedani]